MLGSDKSQTLQVGLGCVLTHTRGQEHLGKGHCVLNELGREKMKRWGQLQLTPSAQGLSRRRRAQYGTQVGGAGKSRGLGGRLAQTRFQQTEGCFIYLFLLSCEWWPSSIVRQELARWRLCACAQES